MKKPIIILGITALIASGCGQSNTKKQMENNTKSSPIDRVDTDTARDAICNEYQRNAGNINIEEIAGAVSQNSPTDSVYTSPVRPNEKLQIGEIYTDTFEYADYVEDEEYYFIFQRDSKEFRIKDNTGKDFAGWLLYKDIESKAGEYSDDVDLHRGDKVVVEWKLSKNFLDDGKYNIIEVAVKVNKIKD